jgi:hypothetical protein
MAIALAWLKPDGATVVGFLAAGLILTLLAIMPRLPSEVGIGGSSLKWGETIVEREYARHLTDRIQQILAEEAQRRMDPTAEMGTTSGGFEADRETALRLAREAKDAPDLLRALDIARQAAEEQAMAVRYAIGRAEQPSREEDGLG